MHTQKGEYGDGTGNGGKVLEKLSGGAGYKVLTTILNVPGQDHGIASFENYHLSEDLIEGALQATELFDADGLRWMDWGVPQDLRDGNVALVNDATLLPHCRVCIARRRS